MKIRIGYYAERDLEVDDKFLPLDDLRFNIEHGQEAKTLIDELVEKIKKNLTINDSLQTIFGQRYIIYDA